MKRASQLRPRAKTEDLVVEVLPQETLVYDVKRHKAHCLNRAAAVVWHHSDGQTSVSQLADILEEESDLPRDERIVRLALDRLQKARLLEKETGLPKDAATSSRRELVRKLAVGGLAILLPMVATIASPKAARAASTTRKDCKKCIGVGLPCVGGKDDGKTCISQIKKGKLKCKCK